MRTDEYAHFVANLDIDARNALPADVWLPLDPIPQEQIIKPDRFPFDALGPVLGDASKAIATEIQAPDSLAAGSVLAASSLAVQPFANVLLPHGQRTPLSLFVITGAGSGDRKTAVDSIACKEIEEVRRQQARAFAMQMDDFTNKLGDHPRKDKELATPHPKCLTTGNATIEGISRLLKHQSSVGIFSGEGGEMLGGHSLRDEKRASGLAFYLKAWGGETIDSLRGGEGLVNLIGRRMAMHILVQPVLLGRLLSDPLAQGQGLLARCLIAQPESLAGYRPYRHSDPAQNPAVVAYQRRIKHLLEIPVTVWEGGDGFELKPRDLVLSDDAQALWIAFYNQIEKQQATGNGLEGARPFASKVAEHAARIAGVIAMVEDPTTHAIPAWAMDGGIQVGVFYLNEHLRLTGSGQKDRHHSQLRELLGWLQENGPLVIKKDLLQKSPRPLRVLKASGLAGLMTDLCRRGYARDLGTGWEIRNVQA